MIIIVKGDGHGRLVQDGFCQTPIIDFPSEYLMRGSTTRDDGTIHLSHSPT
jgi:hypothetical protein